MKRFHETLLDNRRQKILNAGLPNEQFSDRLTCIKIRFQQRWWQVVRQRGIEPDVAAASRGHEADEDDAHDLPLLRGEHLALALVPRDNMRTLACYCNGKYGTGNFRPGFFGHQLKMPPAGLGDKQTCSMVTAIN